MGILSLSFYSFTFFLHAEIAWVRKKIWSRVHGVPTRLRNPTVILAIELPLKFGEILRNKITNQSAAEVSYFAWAGSGKNFYPAKFFPFYLKLFRCHLKKKTYAYAHGFTQPTQNGRKKSSY